MPRRRTEATDILRVRFWPILFGLLAGLGVAVLLQQFAVTPLTTWFLLAMLLAGVLLVGIAVPTILMHAARPPPAEESTQPRGRWFSISLVIILILLAIVVAAMGAHAQGDETHCTASINGQIAEERVVLPENGTIDWTLTSHTGNIRTWDIALKYAWFTFPLDVGIDHPPVQRQKDDTASLDDYPRLGVGVYRVTGTITDEENNICAGTLDVVVPGNPLLTPMGVVSALFALGGILGAIITGKKERIEKVEKVDEAEPSPSRNPED